MLFNNPAQLGFNLGQDIGSSLDFSKSLWSNFTDPDKGDDEEDPPPEEPVDPSLMRLMFASAAYGKMSDQFNNPAFSLALMPMMGLFFMGYNVNNQAPDSVDTKTIPPSASGPGVRNPGWQFGSETNTTKYDTMW